MASATTTTDHQEIQEWVDARNGFPATVKDTNSAEDVGILRIGFDPKEDGLQSLEWKTFFEKFESDSLAFLYQEKTEDGSTSRFCKFVDRE